MTKTTSEPNHMTVRGLLEEPLMADARVVAGLELVDNDLNWVLPLSEVLSATGALDAVGVYVRPEALQTCGANLAALSARGATTLLVDGCMDTDVFPMSGWPPALVVIELTTPVGFAALNRLLAERALSQEVHVMRYSTQVHGSLAGLFHRGAGLQTLVREVSNLARNPAVALDARGVTVASHGLNAETVGPLTRALSEILAVDLPASARRSHGHDTRVASVTESGETEWTCVASAIRLGRTFEGWVAVLVPGRPPGRHDVARHSVLTEQATAIVGSEMLRQRSVDEAEERARGDFVQALVHGSFSSEHDMRTRAEHHEIDMDARFGVFVAPGLLPSRVDNPAATLVRLARYAAGVSPHPDAHAYVTVIGDLLVVVRTIVGTSEAEMVSEMAEYATAMVHELGRRRGSPAPVAYGQPARGATEVREAYRQARVALGIARRLHRTDATSYQELRSFTVLADVADTEKGRRLAREVLAPLQSSPDLLDTLSTYLIEGGNINATARALNMHRNTMLAKLDRISRMLGMDIRVPDNQFTAWLAIRLDLLDEFNAAVDRETSFRR